MKTKLMAMVLLAGSTMFAAERFGGEARFGGRVPARVEVVRSPCPGPGYVWTNGYWVAPHDNYRGGEHRVVREYSRGYRR